MCSARSVSADQAASGARDGATADGERHVPHPLSASSAGCSARSRARVAALGEVVAQPLEPLVNVAHPVAAQRGVEAHGIHVDGLRALRKARVRGGVDGLREGVCGQPAARHAEHRRDERDGDEHEDDVRDHAPDPTVADRAYSGRVAAGVGLAGPVGGCRTPPSPPLGVSAATIAATASSTSSVTVSRSRSRG